MEIKLDPVTEVKLRLDGYAPFHDSGMNIGIYCIEENQVCKGPVHAIAWEWSKTYLVVYDHHLNIYYSSGSSRLEVLS